jgi:hypothetical protein
MPSLIDPENINTEYPIPRTNNNSQVFRDTFSTIKISLETARDEITELQNRGILAGENITITPSLADPAKLIISSTGGGGGGGNMSVYISDTPPPEASEGDLWFNSSSGEMFIYYVDQDSSQWVGLTTSKVSQLENDLNFIAEGSNVSSLINDSGYVTEVPSTTLIVKEITTDYILTSDDIEGVLINVNSPSLVTITLPMDPAIPIGTPVMFGQIGVGEVLLQPGPGCLVRTPESLYIHKQFGKATAIKISADTWDLEGNLLPGPGGIYDEEGMI